MEITYANSRIEKICTDAKRAKKELGSVGAKILLVRLNQLESEPNLEKLRFFPGNFHELTGDRWGQLAVSLGGLPRLIFEPNHDPRPTKPDGGLDWLAVTSVTLVEIVDYH
jgi:proteic killer suppression protein